MDNNKYYFTLIFDTTLSNPNGDPGLDNRPRTITTNDGKEIGFVTGTSIKRKIRDYINEAHLGEKGYDIFVNNDINLKTRYDNICKACGISAKEVKKLTDEEKATIKQYCMKNYYDFRMFGQIFNVGSDVCKAKGATIINNALSVSPIIVKDMSITHKTHPDDSRRSMGSQYIVEYGLYKTVGFINYFQMKNNNITAKDIEYLQEALCNFESDGGHSATRSLKIKKVYFYTMDKKTFANITMIENMLNIKCNVEQPTSYNDYTIIHNDDKCKEYGIEVKQLIPE